MKGVVFTEFLDMVEDKFGYEVVDTIVSQDGLASEGAYTAVGTYPHEEMAQLVTGLTHKTGIDAPVLLNTFGRHLCQRFSKGYSSFFKRASGSFDFLMSIDSYIHVEVLKLYPDAELPKFEGQQLSETVMQLDYFSERKMGDFAEGMIISTFDYFNEDVEIVKTVLDEDGKKVRFLLTRKPRVCPR